MSRTLLRLKREGGISLETPQRKRASSHVEGRISCFLSSYSKKPGVPLELQRGPQGPTSVASGKSGVHASCEGPLGFLSSQFQGICSHLELKLEPQVSSPGLTWILGFLWSFNRGVRPCLSWRHASPFSSQAVKVVSGFLSS